MTVTGPAPLIGRGVDRLDGPAKVSGAAAYVPDLRLPGMVYAATVRSTIAAGRIVHIDDADAAGSPGVLAVITHRNAPRLRRGPRAILVAPLPPLQDAEIHHHGQFVAVVVAQTREQAVAAAARVRVRYEAHEPVLDRDSARARHKDNPYFLDMKRGDMRAGLTAAELVVRGSYSTAAQTHNPLGLFSTVAEWQDLRLVVHESTQNPFHVRSVLARMLGVHERDVEVRVPFVGGGFGAGLRTWPHTLLAAVAAREVGRPVQLMLTRPEMFTSVGHRPDVTQELTLGATRDGRLTAIDHESTSTASWVKDTVYQLAMNSTTAYACPNVAARDKRVHLNIPPIAHMRGPGEAEHNFALETLLDELAWELDLDPIDLRLRNYAEEHPQTGLPWSSKALRECYAAGAERFGWLNRDPRVGSMRDGRWLVGYGMAGVTYSFYPVRCQARATLLRDGSAVVASGATDIGTGTITVMSQLAAETLGLPLDRVRFELGDTALPEAPAAGGSALTAALGTAVHNACVAVVQELLELAGEHAGSAFAGCDIEDVVVDGGFLRRADDPSIGATFADLLNDHDLDELSGEGASAPSPKEAGAALVGSLVVSRLGRFGRSLLSATRGTMPAGAFGAKFVEVRVDPDLGLVRVARVVSAIDAGRILNEKTARSQILGGTVGGIGQALLEETVFDPRTGRIANASFSDYLVPVNADVPDMDVLFVGEPDTATPIGTKGVGEIGLVGIAAAVANAVFHATGKRVRDLPITVEKLLVLETV